MEIQSSHISVSTYVSIKMTNAKKKKKDKERQIIGLKNVLEKKNPPPQWLFIKFLTFESLHNTCGAKYTRNSHSQKS